ncbi:MAG: tyrosine-type recombinase/integrase [Deinococcota bacterium]
MRFKNRPKPTVTLAGLFEQFLSERAHELRPRTRTYYSECFVRFVRFAGEEPELTRELFHGYFRHLSETHSANGVLTRWRGIKVFLNWAYREGHIEFDVNGVKNPRDPKTQKTGLSEDDVRALYHACLNERDRCLIGLLIDTGLRSQELRFLTPGDIDHRNRTIRVKHGKGGKERKVPFSTVTQRDLRKGEARREPASPWLFHNIERSYGEQLTTTYLSRLVARIAQRAGLPSMGPHLLRHTFASSFLAQGGDSMFLKELLGHESIQVTQKYVKLVTTDVRREHELRSPLTKALFGRIRN